MPEWEASDIGYAAPQFDSIKACRQRTVQGERRRELIGSHIQSRRKHCFRAIRSNTDQTVIFRIDTGAKNGVTEFNCNFVHGSRDMNIVRTRRLPDRSNAVLSKPTLPTD